MTREEKRAFWDKEHERIAKEVGISDFHIIGLIRGRMVGGIQTFKELIERRKERIYDLDTLIGGLQKSIKKWETVLAKADEAVKSGKENRYVRAIEKAKGKKANLIIAHTKAVENRNKEQATLNVLNGIKKDQLKIILQEVKI